jgi:uncharacterized protein
MESRSTQILLTTVLALVVGFFSGLQGISRDDLLIAGLLGFGIVSDQATAAGTTLFSVIFPISIAAVWEYYKVDKVDIPLGLIIVVGYMISAYYGAKVNLVVSESTTLLSIIIMQALTTLYFGYKYVTLPKSK